MTKRDGRLRFRLFPLNRYSMRRYLYAIGFADGRTKIGCSYHPRERIVDHWRQSEVEVAWVHLFNPPGGFKAERRALELAAVRGQRIARSEVFTGLDRAAALECGRQALRETVGLPHSSIPRAINRSSFSMSARICSAMSMPTTFADSACKVTQVRALDVSTGANSWNCHG